jgi:hypothetical protein
VQAASIPILLDNRSFLMHNKLMVSDAGGTGSSAKSCARTGSFSDPRGKLPACGGRYVGAAGARLWADLLSHHSSRPVLYRLGDMGRLDGLAAG